MSGREEESKTSIEERKGREGKEPNIREVSTRINELTSRVTENSEKIESLASSHSALQDMAIKTRDTTGKLSGTMRLINQNQKSLFAEFEPVKNMGKEMALYSQSERVVEKPKQEMAFESHLAAVIDKPKQECKMDDILLKIIEMSQKMDTNHEELKNDVHHLRNDVHQISDDIL